MNVLMVVISSAAFVAWCVAGFWFMWAHVDLFVEWSVQEYGPLEEQGRDGQV